MNIARINKTTGLVENIEVWTTAPAETSEHLFVEAGSAGIGWSWDGGALVAPVIPLAELKTAKIAALRALRRSKTLFMTYTFGGVTYTDVPADYALSAVTGTILAAQLSAPDEPFWWELKPGVNIQWYVADAEAYGIAIRAHIQACFDNCVDLGTAINAAADQAALDAIDITTGWPA